MVHCQLWAFDKKKNSTKQPTDSGTAYTGEIKEGFSVSELAICFNFGQTINAPIYNYMHIDELRRYYFIMDWKFAGGFWYATCAVDVLASFKTEIGNSMQYVTRAYSNYNPNILDSAYITEADNLIRLYDLLTPANFWGADAWGNNGTVVIGVIGSNASSVGAVTYYAMQLSTFGAFMQTMLSGITWANISATEISEELQKALINPTQYIVSCRWYPIVYSGFSGGYVTTNINLGWWSFPVSGARVLNTISSAWISRQNYLTIPKHPQSNVSRLGYLQLAPYSDYVLKFLPFGIFALDTTELYNKTYLHINVDVNLMTGDSILKLVATDVLGNPNFDNAFMVVEGAIGVTLPIGQVTADIGRYKQSLGAGLSQVAAAVIEEV